MDFIWPFSAFYLKSSLTRGALFVIIYADSADLRKRVRKIFGIDDGRSMNEKGAKRRETGKNPVSCDEGKIKKPVFERGEKSF